MNRCLTGSLLLSACGLLAVGCGTPSAPPAPPPTAVVIFSQANTTEPWRKMYEKEMAAAVQQHAADFKFQETDAGGDAKKQISQIKDAIAKKPKVLMVSPVSEEVGPAVDEAHAAGICVFLLDLPIKGSKADCFVGAKNLGTGADMAVFYCRQMHKGGSVLIVPGPAGSGLADQRKAGMQYGLHNFAKQVKTVLGDDCGGSQSKAQAFVAKYIQAKKPVDAVFAVDDDMALGAVQAIKDAKLDGKYVFGIGACQQKVFDAIKDGTLFATFSDPPGGPSALDLIPDFIKGTKPPKESFVPEDEVRKDTMDNYLKQHPTLGD